ncbi:MAG: hypothetical protein WAM39_21625 [Bryobacteraceae bacterium]
MGKRQAHRALVESFLTARGPRQRVVWWLGAMDERGRLAVRRCAQRDVAVQSELLTENAPEWVEVDRKRVRVERSRHFGGPWLGLELARRLELDRFPETALPSGREEIGWASTALVLVLGRLCKPSSELHLAEHFYQASAMPDLSGFPPSQPLRHAVGLSDHCGNRHDATTLQQRVGHVEELYGRANCIWVLDRGMVSEQNVAFPREGGRRYIVGTAKSSLKKFWARAAGERWEAGAGGTGGTAGACSARQRGIHSVPKCGAGSQRAGHS